MSGIHLEPEQEEEYQKNWEQIGYGRDIFLDWYEIDMLCKERYQCLGTRIRPPSDEAEFQSRIHTFDMNSQYGNIHTCKARFGVDFAEAWWDAVGGNNPLHAMRLHMIGLTPEEYVQIKNEYPGNESKSLEWFKSRYTPEQSNMLHKLKFRSPGRCAPYMDILGEDRMQWMVDNSVNCPKGVETTPEDFDYWKEQLFILARKIDYTRNDIDKLTHFVRENIYLFDDIRWEDVTDADLKMTELGIGPDESCREEILSFLCRGSQVIVNQANRIIDDSVKTTQVRSLGVWIRAENYSRVMDKSDLYDFAMNEVPPEWALADSNQTF